MHRRHHHLHHCRQSKSKKVDKLGDGANLFNLPVVSKKINYGVGVPSPSSASSAFPKSTFVAAAPLVASNLTVVVTCDWKEAVDASSQETYYYHGKTKVTTWDMPEEYRKFKEYEANKAKADVARKAKFAAKLRESKGEGLMLKKKMAEENDDDDDEGTAENEKAALSEEDDISVPSDLEQPMEKKKHQTMLLAARKFNESAQFEFILKLKQATNPDFAFLNEGGEFHPYYEWLKEENNEARMTASIKKEERMEEERKKKAVASNAPVGLLGMAYSSDEDDSDNDDDDVGGGGALVPPGEVKDTIKTMVAFVLKNGLPFEETVREREKHRDTVKFAFLQKDSPYYPFYVKERDAAILERDGGNLEDEMDELERAAGFKDPKHVEAEVDNFHQAYVRLYEGGSGRSTPDTPDRDEGAASLSSSPLPMPTPEDTLLWQQYVTAKAAEAAALVAARGGIVKTAATSLTPAAIAAALAETIIPGRVETVADGTEEANAASSAAVAAVAGIKKRSRREGSKFDLEAEKKSVKDESMTQEEKDELRRKRLKRAKMMSGHLKLKMLETKVRWW
jgi:hypothetical protein